MAGLEPVGTRNLDRYGDAPLPWSRAQEALEKSNTADVTWFLGAVDPDGTPHAAGVGALWLDDELYFTSGSETRKSRDLAANPGCTVSVRLEGIDLVFEGRAIRETDPATLRRAAERYREGGWPVEVAADAFTAPFSAPSAGPPPWQLYRVGFESVFGVATTDPQGATRWTFDR